MYVVSAFVGCGMTSPTPMWLPKIVMPTLYVPATTAVKYTVVSPSAVLRVATERSRSDCCKSGSGLDGSPLFVFKISNFTLKLSGVSWNTFETCLLPNLSRLMMTNDARRPATTSLVAGKPMTELWDASVSAGSTMMRPAPLLETSVMNDVIGAPRVVMLSR